MSDLIDPLDPLDPADLFDPFDPLTRRLSLPLLPQIRQAVHVYRHAVPRLVVGHLREQVERPRDVALNRLGGRREVNPLDLVERVEHRQHLAHRDGRPLRLRRRDFWSSASGRVLRILPEVAHARFATRIPQSRTPKLWAECESLDTIRRRPEVQRPARHRVADIQAIGQAVDLDGDALRDRGLQHPVEVEPEGLAPQQEPAGRMSEGVHPWVLDGAQQPVGERLRFRA